MNSLDKRQTGRHGGSHGHQKYSDGFSDESSVGSLMDETDREVSHFTDRAFRSLCIGEDAVYNDLEVSTPTECQTAFVRDGEQKKDLKLLHQEKEGNISEVASLFQHSYLDTAQDQCLRDECLAYISNGSTEEIHQQSRSSSRVSSLIRSFRDSGAPDVQQLNDKYKDESWDKSALISIQRELSEFSSTYQNFKSYENYYHQESTSLMMSSTMKFKSLNYTNFFCHSEFSPFQLWKDYNKFPFEREQVSRFSNFPRWYNSPLYKELTASQRISNSPFESRQLDQMQIEDIASSQRSRPTVIQRASAIEKRCESELAPNCPPWKRNNNLVRNKLPNNRPSTVSPTNEMARRPDSSLLYCIKNMNDILQPVRNVSSSEISSSSTPFNITQLLTPVIHKRQDTEISEILQLAHTPLIPDYSFQRESDRKSLPDVKQMRELNSYKSKASSLLFNIKDNRKRVKSTYSPPKFGLELSDRNKQLSKLEGLESKFNNTAVPKENIQGQSTGLDPSGNCNLAQQAGEHTENANRTCNNGASMSHYGPTKQNSHDKPHIKSPLDNSSGSLDTGRTIEHLGSRIPNNIFNAHSTKPLASMAENQKREDQFMRPVVTPSKESFKGEIAALIEMDKQRKATAKQYLPSFNETYMMKQESYINNVNDSRNHGSFPKGDEVQESEIRFQNYSSANIQNDNLKDNPVLPTKDVNQTICMEDKHQTNEGAITYQPYKYDPNKKWYIATGDNRHNKDKSGMPTDNILEQPVKTTTQNLLKTSYISQQSASDSVETSQTVRTEEQKQEKNKKIQSVQNTDVNIKTSESKFNINDILFIRDNEQAKRLQEKCSPNASVTDATKLQHLTSPVLSDITDNKATASKVKQEQTQQDQSITVGNITRDSHILNDDFAKINSGIKDVVRKDRESDKMSRRVRGQTKQEILTSKLKAHAQKEISAIKEKELAKQNSPLRNNAKQSTTENNDKGQVHQEKKEITAEKLNHLFQDVTYSSLSLNNDVYLKTESVQNSEVRLSKRDRKSPCVDLVNDKFKNKEAIINSVKDKSNIKVTEITQDKYQYQKNDQRKVQSNENLLSKSSSFSPKELTSLGTVEDRTVSQSAKPLVRSSPNIISKEKDIVKTEDQTSNLSTKNSTNNTEHVTSAIKKNDSPKPQIFVMSLTNHKQPPEILEQARQLDQNISQTIGKPAANRNTEITRLTEKTIHQESTSNAKHHEIIQSPSSWTNSKDEKEVPAFMSTEGFKAITSAQQTNPLQDKHRFENEDNNHISNNQEPILKKRENEDEARKIAAPKINHQVYCKNNAQDKDIKTQTGNTAQTTTKGGFVQEPEKNGNKELGQEIEAKKPNMEEHENGYSLLKEFNKIKSYDVPQNVSLLKLKDGDTIQKSDILTDTASLFQKDMSNSRSNLIDMAEDEHEGTEKTSAVEKHSKKENIEVKRNVSEPIITENKKLVETISSQNINNQHVSTTDSDTSANLVKPESESSFIHIANQEESSQNEPVIYNICVSSKTNDITEDEPMIFSISISSIGDSTVPQDSMNQNQSIVGQTSLSEEQAEKKRQETFDNKDTNSEEADKLLKEQEQTEGGNVDGIKEEAHAVCLENKSSSKKTEVFETKQETVTGKCDSPASKSKPDCNRSTEVNSIGLAYERLLVKYGLRNSDIVVRSEQDQDNTCANIKERTTRHHSPKFPARDVDHESSNKSSVSVDTNTKHSKELRRLNAPKEATEPLKQNENSKVCNVTLNEKYRTVTSIREGMERAVGEMGNKLNKKRVNDSNILENKTLLNCAPTGTDNLNIQSTVASKSAATKERVKLEGNKQVRQEGQTIQTELKKTSDEIALSKTVENENAQVKCMNDKLLTGMNPADIGERSTVNDKPSHNIADCDSKISATVPEETKTKFTSQDKRVPDVPLVQNNKISSNEKCKLSDSKRQCRSPEECTINAFNPVKPRKTANLTKDTPKETSQRNRTDIYIRDHLEQQQSIFKAKETKPPTVAYEPVVGTSDSGVNDDVITNASVTKHTDQGAFPDKHIPQNTCVIIHNTTNGQMAIADLPKNADEYATSLPSKTTERTKRIENEKLKSEECKNEKNEITTVSKNNPLSVSSLIKTEKSAEYESTKSVNKKETTGKTHDENKTCYDQPTRTKTGQFRKDTRQRTEIRANKDEHSSNVNVYQYHPLKGFIPEIKENRHDTVFSERSNNDTLFNKQDDNQIKSTETQNERKAIKPEISALADYARLRVISAEADSNTEKNILQTMNTSQKYNLSVGKPQTVLSEQIKKASNKYENKSETRMPLHSNERHNHKIRDGLLEGRECSARDSIIPHPKPRSLTKNSDDRKLAVKNKDISTSGHVELKKTTNLPEKRNGCQHNHNIQPIQDTHIAQNSVVVVDSKNDTLPKFKQTVRKDVNKECLSQSSMDSIHNNNVNLQQDRQTYVVPPETTEELQYYIVNALEKKPKLKSSQEPVPLRQNIDIKKVPEVPVTGPRSNSSSPAMGKPTMFKIKDNTNKTSSVTKTVRPRFHRSLSQEPRVRSPNEAWWGAEKNRFDHNYERKMPANNSASREPSMSLYRAPNANEIQSRNCLFSPGAKELKRYNNRIQTVEDDSRSFVSEMSEDHVASTVITADSTISHDFHNRRDAYSKPESSCYERPESVCSERPDSVCYERPESVCSEIRSLSKPPVVPLKTEKALRRAQKLTTRRIKKAEIRMASDTQGQTETSIQGVSSMPTSPMEHIVSHQPAQASPSISHYHVQPNFASQAPSIMAHSFPITQRKLLQDPNSGQYFMVDMPVQVKTKTFFDPATGKYLQLNVRQSPQNPQSTPVEVLGHSYVVYPGYLPMSVSVPSVPSLRSSSQMSGPATLQEEQSKLQASSEQRELENYKTEDDGNVHQCNVPMYGTHEQKMHSGNVRLTPRNTHIITMTELDDFAIENT